MAFEVEPKLIFAVLDVNFLNYYRFYWLFQQPLSALSSISCFFGVPKWVPQLRTPVGK